MTAPSRALARAARRLADVTTTQIAESAGTRQVIATVAGVSGSVVTVSWRGQQVTASGKNKTYTTPAVGDRVICDLVDNQLFVAYPIDGQP